jgi:drug/metabolite transporter (DMT)-like permease
MGIGGIFVSFAVVVFILELFTRRTDAVHQLPTMSALGVIMIVGGGVLFALGYLLNRTRPAATDAR